MAKDVNKVILVGNAGKDPDIKLTKGGHKIVVLSVGTNEVWRDKASGKENTMTDWHRVVVINEHVGEIIEKRIKKGSRVYVEGQLHQRKYVDDKGVERYVTEIIVGKFKGEVIDLMPSPKAHKYDESAREHVEW